MTQHKQRYFVLHLAKPRSGQTSGKPFEIQVLDSRGRGRLLGYAGYTEETLEVGGHSIPKAVLEAARRQPKGQGDYVDSEGNSIPWFGPGHW